MAVFLRMVLALPLAVAISSYGQSVTPTLSDSLKGTAELDRNIFKAGEAISLRLRLSIPAPRDLQLNGNMYCGSQVGFSGTARKGDTEVDLKATLDSFAPSGHCSISEFQIGPPPTISNAAVILPSSLKLAVPIQFEVIGVPRISETFDASVTGELNLSEKQYLRSRSVPLKTLRDSVMSFLSRNANEDLAQNSLLLQTLADAKTDLLQTHQVFTARYRLERDDPVFFQDLERRYDALLIDIRRHRTKLTLLDNKPRMWRVQELRTRPVVPKQETVDPSLAGTYPPDADETLGLIEWNINVYLALADFGKETFSISIVSLPSDATVSAKRIGEEYTTLGTRTTISEAKFPIAIWTFKFTKPNCKDYFRRFDPVHDSSKSLEVELDCAR